MVANGGVCVSRVPRKGGAKTLLREVTAEKFPKLMKVSLDIPEAEGTPN